jgi:hypothetical protein
MSPEEVAVFTGRCAFGGVGRAVRSKFGFFTKEIIVTPLGTRDSRPPFWNNADKSPRSRQAGRFCNYLKFRGFAVDS